MDKRLNLLNKLNEVVRPPYCQSAILDVLNEYATANTDVHYHYRPIALHLKLMELFGDEQLRDLPYRLSFMWSRISLNTYLVCSYHKVGIVYQNTLYFSPLDNRWSDKRDLRRMRRVEDQNAALAQPSDFEMDNLVYRFVRHQDASRTLVYDLDSKLLGWMSKSLLSANGKSFDDSWKLAYSCKADGKGDIEVQCTLAELCASFILTAGKTRHDASTPVVSQSAYPILLLRNGGEAAFTQNEAGDLTVLDALRHHQLLETLPF